MSGPTPVRRTHTVDERIATLLTIRQDIRADVEGLEGQDFTGRNVAVALGQLSAIVDALAGIILEQLLDETSGGSHG